MNRKSFFRNLLGAVAAVVVGRKLDVIPVPTETLPTPILGGAVMPGVGRSIFTLTFHKGWLTRNDIIRTHSGGEFYVCEEGGKLMARSITHPDHVCELVEVPEDAPINTVRMCSALPENESWGCQ